MTKEEAIRELIAMKPHIDASMSVMGEVAYNMAIEALKKQKTGKWIKDEEQSKEHTEPIFICSCCQNNSAWGTEERTRYCSFCGAKMEIEK